MAVKETDRRTIVDRKGVSKRVRIGRVEWPPRQEEVVKREVEVGRLLIAEQQQTGTFVSYVTFPNCLKFFTYAQAVAHD